MSLALKREESQDFAGYTFADYVTMKGRWELIYGRFYNMSPAPNRKHQRMVGRLFKELDGHLTCHDKCEVFVSPIDWKINERNVVQPDVAIFCEQTDASFFTEAPVVVVEVLSPATAIKDITVKYKLYEKAGVLYYCLVSPEEGVADIFMLKDGVYGLLRKAVYPDEFLFEWEGCSSKITFSNVFEYVEPTE